MGAQTPTISPESGYSTEYVVKKYLRLTLDYLVMAFLAFIFIFPIVFMLITAIKENESQILRDVSSLMAFVPYGELGLKNFFDVFARQPFGRYMFNSTLIVSAVMIGGLFINSLAAYALARMRFRGRRILVAVIVALIIIPLEAVAIPMLLEVNRFGWLDTYHVQIIPFLGDAFQIFLFYQFFIGIPKDLEEAALVDGAGRFRIYWNVIVPLAKPAFATVAILRGLYHWSMYIWPLMVTRSADVRPLMIGMEQFFGQYPRDWGDIMAFAAMITVPVLILFIMFQRWFVQSVASSGVKG